MGNVQKELPERVQAFYTVESKDSNPYSQYVKKIRLFDKKNGLTLPSAPGVLWRAGLEPQPPEIKSEPAMFAYSGTLTEEQSYVVTKAMARLPFGYGSGLVVMKTGRGKTHVIMSLAERLGMNVLVLAHSLKTASEIQDKFREYCKYETGMVGGGKYAVRPVTVCTHDSFVMMDGKVGDFDAIFYDEADYNLSKNMLVALCRSGAKVLYGFTGTPFRKDLDQKDMEKVFGETIQFKGQDLGGYNELPEIEVVKYRGTRAEFQRFDELKSFLVGDADRLSAQMETVSKLLSSGRKCVLMLTERVEEANLWSLELHKSGIRNFVICGTTKTSDDEDNIAKYVKAGKPFVICATVGKMARGADVPPIDTVCLFSALQFRGTVVQAVGRALRKYPDKAKPLIVDWNDLPVLARQASMRRTAYRKEYGKDVKITQSEHERNRSGGQLSLSAEGIQAGEGIPSLVRLEDK